MKKVSILLAAVLATGFGLFSLNSESKAHKDNQQRAGSIDQAVYKLTGANGPVIFTSSTGRQVSIEAPEWNNGAFTKALVEGLTGKAADLNDRKMITIKSLDYYIANRVKELTDGKQATTTIIPRSATPDFPIAVVPD